MSAIRYRGGYYVLFFCFLQIAYPASLCDIAIKHSVK